MDNYLIFYCKNLGIMFILTIAVFLFGNKKQIQTILPATFLWLIAEFVLFQPNSYDNNKLMLVCYFFFCVAAADFVWDTIPQFVHRILPRIQKKLTRGVVVSIVAFVGVLAAVLTMGREAVADFELYGSSYVKLAQWAEENTMPDDIFLTNNNHNNAIAALTGRNIVCGTGTFLYFHGLNYQQQEEDLRRMYEEPANRNDLLEKYNVSYIVIGPYELSNYQIPDIQQMAAEYELVYNEDGILVFFV